MLKLDSILEGIAELTGSRLANGSLLALPSSSWNFQSLLQRGRRREGGGREKEEATIFRTILVYRIQDPWRGLLRWISSGFGNRSLDFVVSTGTDRRLMALTARGEGGCGNLNESSLSLSLSLSLFVLIACTYVHTKWYIKGN